MLFGILSVIVFLTILSVLVIAHEWGHFITARWFGVRVEEFGLGFPPKAKALWHSKGTDFTLNWLPLGGFVRLKGETGEDSQDEDSFAKKAVWKRLVILCAGVFMNFVIAVAVFWVGFMTVGLHADLIRSTDGGTTTEQKIVIYPQKDSPASKAGVQAGDAVVSVEGRNIATVDEFVAGVRSFTGTDMTMTVRRSGEEKALSVPVKSVEMQEVVDGQEKTITRPVIGVEVRQLQHVRFAPHIAFIKAAEATANIVTLNVSMLWDIVVKLTQGNKPQDGFVGPVGIAYATGTGLRMGVQEMIGLIAQLSLGLAIMNILPIPALDGGRALFVIIEKITRRPMRASLENAIHAIGFIGLMILVLIITFRDVVRFFF